MAVMTSTHGQLVINGKAVRDRDAMLASIAPEFSPSTPYEAGEYVIHDSEIRKFKEGGHAAGAWSDSDNDPATLDDIMLDIEAAVTRKGGIVPATAYVDDVSGMIDSISVPGGFDNGPGYTMVTLFNKEYKTRTINGITWLCEDFTYKPAEFSSNPSGTPSTPAYWDYNGTVLFNGYAADALNDYLTDGWHVSTSEEWTNLVTYSGGTDFCGIVNKTRAYNGINAFGLCIEMRGYRGVTGTLSSGEGDYRITNGRGIFFTSGYNGGAGCSNVGISWNTVSAGSVRLCKST